MPELLLDKHSSAAAVKQLCPWLLEANTTTPRTEASEPGSAPFWPSSILASPATEAKAIPEVERPSGLLSLKRLQQTLVDGASGRYCGLPLEVALGLDRETWRGLTYAPRVYKLANYLGNACRDRFILPEVAELTWKAWEKVSAATCGRLPVPDACPGPDGQMLLSWERDPHYLELEVFPDKDAEFFYRNENTGSLWDCDYEVGTPVPAEVVARLRLFI